MPNKILETNAAVPATKKERQTRQSSMRMK
jgi:hypothetical protein